jgi:hypothetical protein
MSQMTDYNQLNGTIPTELGQLTNLTYVYIGGKNEDVFCCCSIGVNWLTNVAMLCCN